MRSRWMRSGASSPRSTPDRDREEREVRRDDARPTSHCGHGNPPRSICVPMLATSGANAMSGTVWLTTIHGSRPHSARRQRCMTRPSAAPTIDADQPADRGDAEGRDGGRDHRDEQRRRAATARRLEQPRDHLPDVRHRAVVGARQQHDARAGLARDRADHESLGRTEELVELPDHHDREHADAHPTRRRTARRLMRGRLTLFAVTCSRSAGMTVSPYTRSVSSLLSCWR